MFKKKKQQREPILVQYIKDRIHNRNKNFVMLFVGSTGSGKSYSALRLAELLDPTFDINRVCFRAKDFMNTINSLVEAENKVSGKVVVWDEFGVEHNAREFMTISNRVVNYFFQTSRHLNLVVIMTVPLLSFIDSATRKLCHGIAEMQGINMSKKTASVKVKMLQTNVMTGKEYPKYLRYRRKNKGFVNKRMKFNLPSKELREAYELRKKEFTKQLNKEIMNKLLKVEEKERRKTRHLTPMQEKVTKLLKDNGVEKVAKILGVNMSTIYDHKNEAENRGISFKPIWKDRHIVGHVIEGFGQNSTQSPNEAQV